MALKAPMQRGPRQVRDTLRVTNASSSGKRAGLDPERHDGGFLDGGQNGAPSFLPIGASATEERDHHFLTVFSLSP